MTVHPIAGGISGIAFLYPKLPVEAPVLFTLEEVDMAIPPTHSSGGLVWHPRKQPFDWFRVVAEVSSGQLVPLPVPRALKEEHLLVERPIESCIHFLRDIV